MPTYQLMTLKPLLGTLETIIQNHFKSHMLGLMLIGIVSFLKLLEIGMHSLHLLYECSEDCISRFTSLMRSRELSSHSLTLVNVCQLMCHQSTILILILTGRKAKKKKKKKKTDKLTGLWLIRINSLVNSDQDQFRPWLIRSRFCD